jgi:hypothetical protein
MKKPLLRILELTVAGSFAAFSANALAEVTTAPPAPYSPLSVHYGHYTRAEGDLATRVDHWLDDLHGKSEGPSKLDPRELNHMYQCDTPICRGAR